ncbi:MAG: hypothetical protein Q4G44_07550 [Alcaligenaceae bacterium]|nr:hypothetical protein [Alcaligenaceae bacterium]
MYKKSILSLSAAVALSLTGGAFSSVAYASAQAEQELRTYLASFGLEDSFSWERIEGDSLADASVYGVTFISDKGSDDEQKYLIKKMDFDDYSVTDDRISVEVKYLGVTDEDGEHVLLSKRLSPEGHFQSLAYEQLDDIEVKLKYTMDKASGTLAGGFEISQDDVLDGSLSFKTEGIDVLFEQLKSMDAAVLDPDLLMISAMSTKIHHINISVDDDGYNKRMLEHNPQHESEVGEHYQACVQTVGEFDLKVLEQGCMAMRDYLLDKEDKLQISINPAKPFSIAEYMPMFMLVGNAGPDALATLVQKIVGELNLKISN